MRSNTRRSRSPERYCMTKCRIGQNNGLTNLSFLVAISSANSNENFHWNGRSILHLHPPTPTYTHRRPLPTAFKPLPVEKRKQKQPSEHLNSAPIFHEQFIGVFCFKVENSPSWCFPLIFSTNFLSFFHKISKSFLFAQNFSILSQ